MSSKEEQNKNIVPKAPRLKITTIPKKISYIYLIEADDDSESNENEVEIKRVSVSKNKFCKGKEEGYFSDDRYEDSFDEEFGDGCETNPDSGNTKIMAEKDNFD